ncbi:MAG: hypothetical protein M3417_09720 [Actinomycetota bacterium]|nr:hypothetical protein [Actinomycetota bacterium]
MALTITACGSDDESSSSSKPQTLAVEVTGQGQGKFSLEAPESVEAGVVEISLKTPGDETSHDAQLVRVEGDHSVDEVLEFIAKDGAPTPDWLFAAGGVGQTATGASATQQLAPGKYFILDIGEPEGDDVKSYAEEGATAALEVTGDATDAELPSTDAKITATEYSFTADGLKAGKNEVEFDNAGTDLHHVIAFPYAEGADFAAVKKVFTEEGEPSGPPPLDFEGITGTATLEGGTKQVAELDLERGKYALVCFVSDRKGGPPHVAKGMISEAVVE